MLEFFIVFGGIIIPLMLSALLSASETAITAMSTAKLHKLKTDGNKQAEMITILRADKENLISSILLANNACNILASTVATAILIDMFGNEGVLYATITMTILIIIFAEVLPKTYSLANPERAALSFASFLKVIVTICTPITKTINFIVGMIIKNLKLTDSSYPVVSPTEEIKGTIELHHQEGSVDRNDKEMLEGVFYLGETDVSKVMTHRKNIQTISLDSNIQEILNQIKLIKHTRVPAWKDNPDNIIGILNTHDLLHKMLHKEVLNKSNLKNLLAEPLFIDRNTTLDEQLAKFKAKKTRFAIVIDEYGDIQGIITLSDILEEVVGSINDKHDEKREDIIWQGNSCSIKGDVTIRDFNRSSNWQLPDGDASTVAGLLIHQAEKIPEAGEYIEFNGFKFTILTKKSNQITHIKIEKLKDE
jgi:Mg2+/Co2+ transporter CorB